LKRPICEEYMEYSARDVEDLVEVYHRMNESLYKAFNSLNNISNE